MKASPNKVYTNMKQKQFTYEYKKKLDFLMQEAKSPKLKEIIAKLYGVSQKSGEALLDLVEGGYNS